MTSRFILAAIIFSTFFTACQQGESKSTVSPVNTNVKVDPANLTTVQWLDSTLDKGTITEGEKIEVAYRFKNTGSKPLVIKEVIPSCGCTVAEKPLEPISPGQESVIKALFNSQNKLGPNHRTLTVRANTEPESFFLKFTVVVNKKS